MRVGSRRGLLAAVVTIVVVGGVSVLALCFTGRSHSSVDAPSPPSTSSSATSMSPSPGASSSPTSTQAPASSWQAPAVADVSAVVADVADQHDVQLSVAWYDPTAGVQHTGELRDVPAWSTVKVPLALAVIDQGNGAVYRDDIAAAVRSSDNESASTLWRSLGNDNNARAAALTDVLRRSGDTSTSVPSTQLHPPYSVFGQTTWRVTDQVTFVMSLPQLPAASPVVDDMALIDASQRWGLGRLREATFKGGWGPTVAGDYTVRQFGWFVGTHGQRIPIAMAVQAPTFEAGVSALDELATALG